MKSMIQYKKTERFTMLYSLYRKSNASSDYATNMREIASNEGIGYRSFKAIFDYLGKENLMRMRSNSDQADQFYYASITEAGIFAIEEVFRDENMETPYFPPYREMMM